MCSGANLCGQMSPMAAMPPSSRRKNTSGSPRMVRGNSSPGLSCSLQTAAYQALRRKVEVVVMSEAFFGSRVRRRQTSFDLGAGLFHAHGPLGDLRAHEGLDGVERAAGG